MEMKPYKYKSEMIIEPYENGVCVKVLYECDKTKCAGDCGECHQTSDINYAKRFDLDE